MPKVIPHTVTQVKIVKDQSSPYRSRRLVEDDVTPIHKQKFPSSHPLRARPSLVIPAPNQPVDSVSINRQVFPISNRAASHDHDLDGDELATYQPGLNEQRPPQEQTNLTTTDHTTTDHTTPLRVPPQPALTTQPLPKSVAQISSGATSTRSDGDAIVNQNLSGRKERKIRGLEEWMGWFESVGLLQLHHPPRRDNAEAGDLFIHVYGEDQVQSWIRTEKGLWEGIRPGQKHPHLPGYRLLVKKGKPGWVTRQTIATYSYRK